MPGQLAHSPAKVLRQALINNGLATDPAYNTSTKRSLVASNLWPAFYNEMPDDPDGAVQVRDTTGVPTNKRMIDGEMGGMQGVQIMVRGTAHDSAYARAESIATHLDAISNQSVMIGATEYVLYNVQRSGDVLIIGNESPQSKRKMFSINALVRIRQQ